MSSATIETIVSTPPSGRTQATIFDSLDYAHAVILQGKDIPWMEPLAYSQLLNQTQGLLNADASIFDIGRLYQFFAANDISHILETMTARSRPGFAFKAMSQHTATKEYAVNIVSVLSQTTPAPIIIRVPTPRVWISWAHQVSDAGKVSDIDTDDIENYSAHFAAWLQGFEGISVAGLVIDDRWSGDAAPIAVDIATYQPIFNAAGHNRWPVLHQDDAGIGIVSGLQAEILPEQWWLSDDPAPAVTSSETFRFAKIPSNAVPETVVAKVAQLI